jgi:superoxide dismutase, Cu-Zn family
MTTRTSVAAIFGIAVMTGCNGTTAVTPDPEELEWIGDLVGLQGWEHLTGEAAFRWTEGTGTITAGIVLAGDEPGAVRPWHVHVNSCAQGGGIFGSDAQYPRLTIGADGTAAAVVDVPVTPNPDALYHVNVHLSNDEMGVIIACGDVVLNGAATPGAQPPVIPGY